MNSHVRELIEGVREALELRTRGHRQAWHLDQVESWDAELEEGRIRFRIACIRHV